MDLSALFGDSTWFQLAGQIVLLFTVITGALPDKWVQKVPILSTLWPIFNWLAGNVFNNINHPRGMAAQAEVEKEIDAAKAKVRTRSGLPDVLDGM